MSAKTNATKGATRGAAKGATTDATKGFIDVDEKLPLLQSLPLSLQHMFAMFGASILVPILFNINPATVLVMNGVGTLIYYFLTKGKIPAYLGSSFAFLAPTFAVMAAHSSHMVGFSAALGGYIACGLVYVVVALLVKFVGIGWLHKLFPPAAMGAIVAIIGLQLAPTAGDMAGVTVAGAANFTKLGIDPAKAVTVAMITLLTVVLASVLLRGFFKIIPILIGIVVGYIAAWPVGLFTHDTLKAFHHAAFFALPTLTAPRFELTAVLTILPAAFVVLAEHIGHLVVTSNLVGRDLTKDPGLHRSLMGDGVSTIVSGCFGSVPTTTYGENIGVMAITKVYNTMVIVGAAVISIVLSFSGKLTALIQTIPQPVLGGVSLLLFGSIAAAGIRMLIEEKVDYSKSRNLILTSVVLVTGLSGAHIMAGKVDLNGMSLATIVAMVLSIFFMVVDALKINND